jgi:hypothetical protein
MEPHIRDPFATREERVYSRRTGIKGRHFFTHNLLLRLDLKD